MTDLATRYLGLAMPSPLIASASPVTSALANLRLLARHGAGAVVLPSLFEEEIEAEMEAVERLKGAGSESFAEARSYFPAGTALLGAERTLELVAAARGELDIPVIASLNGASRGGWTVYARRIEDAGASAIELNVYTIPADLEESGAAVEERIVGVVRAVCAAVRVPVAVKLSPYFSAPGQMAKRLVAAGAAGLVLFNRFYQPDIDLARLQLRRDLALSRPEEMRLALLWIGLLSGRIEASLAATTGVDGAEEVVKYVLAGADAVMTTSALLRHGIGHMRRLNDGLAAWLEGRGIGSVGEIRGRLSRGRIADPEAFERGNYITILQSRNRPAVRHG
ncbi:MAG: dihydroorotate dehydrogenase-like protein [Rhodospirillales bacterium]|nr:dihydroorotate dehydrogenase-like protein [Rhodospirillales bacterium]